MEQYADTAVNGSFPRLNKPNTLTARFNKHVNCSPQAPGTQSGKMLRSGISGKIGKIGRIVIDSLFYVTIPSYESRIPPPAQSRFFCFQRENYDFSLF